MWCVKLSDSQRDALRALVQEQDEKGPALAAALEALELGRWDDLPDATLPWDRVSELAGSRGSERPTWSGTSPAGMPPAPPRRRGARKTALVKREKPPA